MAIRYRSISEEERLQIAQDRLRDLEADHYRMEIAGDAGDLARLEATEAKIMATQIHVERLENNVRARSRARRAALEGDEDTARKIEAEIIPDDPAEHKDDRRLVEPHGVQDSSGLAHPNKGRTERPDKEPTG